MKKTTRFAAFLSVLALLTLAAQGQQVYRCGQSYSEKPCPGAVQLDTSDARSQAQKQESKKAIQRDIQLAAELEETRKKEDAMAVASRTPTSSKSRTAKSAKSKKSKPRMAPSDEVRQPNMKSKTKKNPAFFSAAMPPVKQNVKKETAKAAP